MDRATWQRAGGAAVSVVFLVGCGPAAPPPDPDRGPRAVRYEARVEPGLAAVRVRACFEGPAPAALVPVQGEPGEHTRAARDARGRPLPVDGDRIALRGVGPGECVRWVADLERAARDSRFVERRGQDRLAAHEAWLWRPATWPERMPASLELSLPDGVHALTPWPRRPDGTFVLDRSAFTLAAHVALGRFEVERLSVPGAELSVARLDGALEVSDEELRRWLAAAGDAVAGLYGRFPVDEASVIVLPVGPGSDPVAFGLVRRGGGASVVLLVREDATLEGLLGEWVAVHEFTHFALPLLDSEDAWLSEGIATYYQEVLRARAGLQTPLEAWQHIQDGFERGRTVGTARTLTEEADDMHRTHAYWRVYWSGTCFALELDLKLRRATRGRHSLDSALAGVRDLARDRPGSWEGEALLRRIDEVTETRIASRLGARYAGLRTFPETEPLLSRLGLVHGPDGELVFDPDAPLADLRERITHPREGRLAER